MRVLAISFPAWVLVGLALAREVPSSQNANSIENSPGLPINEVKHSNIKEQFRHEGNAIDWETLDKHDEDVGDDDNEKQEPVMPDEVLGDAKDTDWDNLEDSDEFLFTKDTTSVRKVPKNSKASDDIFYFQPLNIASYQPGEVIRMREVTPEAYPENVKAIYQYMVRSTDSLDQAVGIVSTLYVSSLGDGNKLLSFQVPTDSPCVDCAPSVDMADSMKKLAVPFSYGWNVIAPDFQGLHGAFGAAKLAGQATLDAVRGALSTGKVSGMSKSAQFAMWGYSGGSIATGWAATLQPQYAPELSEQLVGAAIGGWITNYDATIRAADGKLAAGLVGLALSGLAQQYTDLIPIYKKYIRNTIRLRSILEGTKKTCLTSGVLRFLGAQFFKGPHPYFSGGERALREPTVRKIIQENRVAFRRETGIPECPLFLHHALKDNIAPSTDTKRAVKNYCDWGISSFEINYVKGTGHMSESREGVPAVVAWLKDRFDGLAPVDGCEEHTWNSLREYPRIDKTLFRKRHESATDFGLMDLEDGFPSKRDEISEETSIFRLMKSVEGDPSRNEFVRKILPLP